MGKGWLGGGILGGALLTLACGGRSVGPATDGASGGTSGASSDAGADACVCPSATPLGGSDCGCPGLSCSFPPVYIGCWDGQAVCSGESGWDYLREPVSECPPELPAPGGPSRCNGEGWCEYEVDVGCGAELMRFSCNCVDASWLLATYSATKPALCDCAAIVTESVCRYYAEDCEWSAEARSCQPSP